MALKTYKITTTQFPEFLYKPLLMHEENFSKLNDFTRNFILKQVALIIIFILNWSFLEMPPIMFCRFDSIARNKSAETAKIYRFFNYSITNIFIKLKYLTLQNYRQDFFSAKAKLLSRILVGTTFNTLERLWQLFQS